MARKKCWQLTAVGWNVPFLELRRALKFRAARYEFDRRKDLARWASSKITPVPLRATLFPPKAATYFGAGDVASFWKRGSPRSGSNMGSSRSSAGVSGIVVLSEPAYG